MDLLSVRPGCFVNHDQLAIQANTQPEVSLWTYAAHSGAVRDPEVLALVDRGNDWRRLEILSYVPRAVISKGAIQVVDFVASLSHHLCMLGAGFAARLK